MIENIVRGIWLFIPIAMVVAAFILYRVYRKRETDISAEAVFLCMIFILWSIVSVIVWRDQTKISSLREMYRSQVKTEGVDENGDLWIVIETNNADRVYSIEKGDSVLQLVEEGFTPCDYPVGNGVNSKTQYYWRYQVVGEGECDLYKVRFHQTSKNEVAVYRISVDENRNITKSVEYGEIPDWMETDDFKETNYTNEAYDFFAKHEIFLYGENFSDKESEMTGELYTVSLTRNVYGRPKSIKLYICPDIRSIFYYYIKGDDTKEWREFRISDNCDISWIREWVDKYY